MKNKIKFEVINDAEFLYGVEEDNLGSLGDDLLVFNVEVKLYLDGVFDRLFNVEVALNYHGEEFFRDFSKPDGVKFKRKYIEYNEDEKNYFILLSEIYEYLKSLEDFKNPNEQLLKEFEILVEDILYSAWREWENRMSY